MTLDVNILTHYYKLAHIGSINYEIFTSITENHQQLLELELTIRHEHPRILVCYYNKCLYYFTFGHNEEEQDKLNLVDAYPNIQLKYSNNITMDQIQDGKSQEMFENLSFLKAVKKMVLYTLSSSRTVELFGNYCVIEQEDSSYSILYLDPILLPSGDLMISCIERSQVKLVKYDTIEMLYELQDNYVIYIIPSGIRCHLFDGGDLRNNIVDDTDVDNDKLLNLIELSTGVKLKGDVVWVKLIPNLKHLNNQTSTISKFIHVVENKKFILWPWKLCLLQLGDKVEEHHEVSVSSNNNPMSLISDFLDFNISNNLQLQLQEQKKQQQQQQIEQQQQQQAQLVALAPAPSSVGSSSDVASGGNTVKDIGSIDLTMTTPIGEDLFNLPASADTFNFKPEKNGNVIEEQPKEQEEAVVEEENEENKPDMELDDLFGDDVSSDESVQEVEVDTNKPDQEMSVSEEQPQQEEVQPMSPEYFDIPKDQMITKLTSPDYSDPGAPPPNPTPFISGISSTNPPSISAPDSTYFPEEPTSNTMQSAPSSIMPPQKSIFSPILFNPIIKSNIDTKYGKGGKFYVDRESSIDLIDEKHKRIRATSVVLYGEEKKRQQQQVIRDEVVIDDESSEESDEDEVSITDSSPLKLNTEEQAPVVVTTTNIPSNYTMMEFPEKQTGINGLNSGFGGGSPFTKIKLESSPFSNHELIPTMSPLDFEIPQQQQQQQQTPKLLPIDKEASATTSPPKILGESSNYLPLILRSINVSTIPNTYLVNNNSRKDKLLTNFAINEEEEEDKNDLEINREMIVKLENLEEFLEVLCPNLVYDFGLIGLKSSRVKYQLPSTKFEQELMKIFPGFKVNLLEFLIDYKQNQETDNSLSFLDDITTGIDNNTLNSLHWDCLTGANEEVLTQVKQLNEQVYNSENIIEEDTYFKLPIVKTRVHKNDNIVNINSIGLEYWKYLNFSPPNQQVKNFQIVLISEVDCGDNFLNLVINNYHECNFGAIARVNLSTVETRPDLDSISNGLLLVNKEEQLNYSEFYIQVNRKLISLVELIKLDLINKTNNFEFTQPLLLLFVNFDDNINSMIQIGKLFRNFKSALTQHQLPLVNIFTKVIPANLIIRNSNLKILSNYKLSKISMNLYNQCPNISTTTATTTATSIYTSIVKDPPSKIQFKFMNTKDSDNTDDIFLHVAYERSIDKNWFSAAWTDPFGLITHTKSWYCNGSTSHRSPPGTARDIVSITDDIWQISIEFFKYLNDVMNNKITTLGGKKFLVLTRINSVIPDDELIQWKRLTTKNKEISLIVLSVNSTPKILFKSEQGQQQQQEQDSIFPFSTSPSVNTSPLNFHSPHQFINASFLSPDTNNQSSTSTTTPGSHCILDDPEESNIMAIIPKVSLPSFNSPTRLGMKIGYLIKPWQDNHHLTFEVNLLSCSNYWDLNHLMKLILNQYKKLIILNDILGMRLINGRQARQEDEVREYKLNGMIPWHIAAVGKSLDYLIHIYVEE
ncbi:Mediator of RNA polymerase II transcription subunit 13 [Spathaspora sp. JA1]|nr:Mediator of RNA polymerase II transcription subunit 13 [Spathaspora sp. JA1]